MRASTHEKQLNPDEKMREDNPCVGITRYRERAVNRCPTLAEMSRVVEAMDELLVEGAINPFFVAGTKVLLMSGARRSEILESEWSWLDIDRQSLVLPDGQNRGEGHRAFGCGRRHHCGAAAPPTVLRSRLHPGAHGLMRVASCCVGAGGSFLCDRLSFVVHISSMRCNRSNWRRHGNGVGRAGGTGRCVAQAPSERCRQRLWVKSVARRTSAIRPQRS
jgi:hypothetical protein